MKEFTKALSQTILLTTQGKEHILPGPVKENLKTIGPLPSAAPPPPLPPPPPPPGAPQKKAGLFSSISA
jgi:hypothetical protein